MPDAEELTRFLLHASEPELGKLSDAMDARVIELGKIRTDVRSMFFGQFLLMLGGMGTYFLAPYAFGGTLPQGLCLVFPGIAVATLPGSIFWWKSTKASIEECILAKEMVHRERERRLRVSALYPAS